MAKGKSAKKPAGRGKNPNSLANLRRGTPARKKQALKRFTTLKQAYLDAFEEIGGADGLAKWAKRKENRTAFYKMLQVMLPRETKIDAVSIEDVLNALGSIPGIDRENLRERLIGIVSEKDDPGSLH